MSQTSTPPAAPRRPAAPIRLPRLRLLPAIVFVMVLMLGVRISDFWSSLNHLSAGAEVVAQPVPPDNPATVQPAPAAEPQPAQPAVAEPAVAEAAPAEPVDEADLTPGEAALQSDLAARRAELDARDRDIAQREAVLAAAEQQVNDKVAELERLRTEIQGMLTQVDDQREAQIASLVKIYEAMRPADAATIFDGLEMDVLIDVLQRMREQKAAPILAAMNPETARSVTSELAQRRNAAQASLAAAAAATTTANP